MKIAFATKDSVHVNEHFGWAKRIDVYAIDQGGYEFIETFDFTPDMDSDDHDDRLNPKIKALKDCTIVYVSAIGAGAAARIINSGMTPIKSESGEEKIEDILTQLQKVLQGTPPPWLRKALKKDAPTFDVVEEEEEEVLV
ncbi:MAG: nitrogen fixation protein NifX [Leptolyngbyaceae bacterium]|nr:nitrogen fixation protein NifX [Leptolyngbyaceae bacterium]